ncbi:MAG: hypothetical protein F6K35_33110 [Okeania sp. SIO2H7]|nr:hypothetical protein [Okeania sp. SIO2H7]
MKLLLLLTEFLAGITLLYSLLGTIAIAPHRTSNTIYLSEATKECQSSEGDRDCIVQTGE